MFTRRSFVTTAAGGAAFAGQIGCGISQDAYPAHPITLVVPNPAGGAIDLIARALADKLNQPLGQNMHIDNRPGAGGVVGAAYVSRAAPDGYTLMMGGAGQLIFPVFFMADLTYDPATDFIPLSQISKGSLVLVVKPSSPAKTVSEFLDFLRSKKGEANYSTTGIGTYPQLAVLLLEQMTGVRSTHIPHRGGPDSVLAVLRGDVDFSINHMPNVISLVKSGSLRALATTGLTRAAAMPDVPTFDEQGVKGYQANPWFGMFAPKKTPQPIVKRLEAEIVKAMRSPDLNEVLRTTGDEPFGGTSEELTTLINDEMTKWTKILKASGMVAHGDKKL